MAWKVEIKEAVIGQLSWFGKKTGRRLLQKALDFLEHDPLAETASMKSWRPNAFAQRELRLFGKYRVLFSVDAPAELVTILLAGKNAATS